MATVFGIDLGTTYSCIARCDDSGKISSLHPSNALLGGVNLPSIIYYEKQNGKPVVGLSAKNALGAPGEVPKIMTFVKRYMGNDYPKDIEIMGYKQKISPIEGSACILHHLLKCAKEETTGSGDTATTKAVITIPASFTNKQRESTKLAAELAGVEVLGLVHEPTAAAISYGIKSGETILVFDLGGGTLDVSLVTNNKGVYKVIAAAGDFDVLGRHIGGKDWDDKLLDLVMEKHNYKIGNIPNLDSETELWQLRNKIEECKINLSTMMEVQVGFPDFTFESISQKQFNDYTNCLVQDCLKVVKATLDSADKSTTNGLAKVDRCVLAGGSSNMPMIKNSLSRFLSDRMAVGRNEKDWLYIANPERAIAEGAAKYAYLLEHNLASNNDNIINIEEKSSHSYGTSCSNRGSEEIIIHNLISSTDPMIFENEKPFPFYPRNDGQRHIRVDLYENNSEQKKTPLNGLKPIFDKYYEFPATQTVTTNTVVNFYVRRDKDGIIYITVKSGGHSQEFRVATVIPLLTKQAREHAIKSLELMDKVEEECK